MKQNKFFLATLLMLVASVFALSAQDSFSPYSKYGYGNLRDNATSAQRSMGGVGYAMQSGRQINVMNPASYAAIDSLTFLFDMGISMNRLWTSDADNKAKDFGGGLDYITMQFPIGKIMGASFGLLPYTSTGYSFGESINNGSFVNAGEGGINLLYGGLAIKPYVPGLSIGANVSYMFGTTTNNNVISATTGSTSVFQRVVEVRDYHLQFGVQYNYTFNRNSHLIVGATYSPAKSLSGTTYAVKYDQTYDKDDYGNVVADTIQTMKLKGNYSIPSTIGAGVSLDLSGKIIAEVDFTYQNWKSVKFNMLDGFESTRFDNRWKVAAGVQYTNNPRGSWIQRVNVRAGIYHDRDYVMVGSNHIRRQGITLGFGIPAPNSKTVINIGVEYNRRRAYPNPLVREDNIFINLGINFNELWFWQNRLR